jgi:hypothetical protein
VSWARLDDRFHDNRKIKRLWQTKPAAVALHVMAITYCALNETDGEIDPEFVLEKVPVKRDRDAMTTALCNTGLWVLSNNGRSFLVNDYLEYNPSRASLDEKRAADAERKRRGRDTQATTRDSQAKTRDASARNPLGLRAESSRSPNGVPLDVRSESTRSPVRVLAESSGPGPARINNPPVVPQGGRRRDNDRYDREVVAYAASLLPNVPQDYAISAIRAALEHVGPDPTAAAVLEWASRYRPLPAEIRELVAKAAKAAA